MDFVRRYEELVLEAEREARTYWVSTGFEPPQINAMFSVLVKRIEELEKALKEKSDAKSK